MPNRYIQTPIPGFSILKFNPGTALRQSLKKGYTFSDFRSDLMSGLVVGMVAIPLGMALSIASGVPPQQGLYTVIIAGGLVALLGGSRFQVTGPTAAFVVILAPIVQKFGLGGLLVAGFLAGIMLILMGLARMGRLIQYIPYPVTTGFTSGIAVVIATLQLKDFFGLQVAVMPDGFFDKVSELVRAKNSFSFVEFFVASITLILLIVWPKFSKKIPAPLIALIIASVIAIFIKNKFPQIQISTIGNRFVYETNGILGHGIPQSPPSFHLPWNFVSGKGASFSFTLENIKSLMPSAFAIAMLGAIESLLSAVVADGMAQTKHDPDSELVALGIANVVCPFFGGIAATGAIARTATNIRFGAKSPISAIIHAIFALVVVLLLAPIVSYLPMAALAALLMIVAYNMSEMKHFFHILRVAPKSDMIVLLICFSLTVAFDMVVGVSVGVVLAALLFMRRMVDVSSTQVYQEAAHPHLSEPLPKEILLYEIAGPLFFGAVQNAVDVISGVVENVRVVIFSLEAVPAMDITGLVAFESAVEKLTKRHKVFLVGVNKQPRDLLIKSDFFNKNKQVQICHSLLDGVELAKDFLLTNPPMSIKQSIRRTLN